MTKPQIFINLPYDIFEAWVDTTIFVTKKRQERISWPPDQDIQLKLITFPKRYKLKNLSDFDNFYSSTSFSDWFITLHDEFLTYVDDKSVSIMWKIEQKGCFLGDLADIQRGVTPYKLSDIPEYASSKPAFSGTVRRYQFIEGKPAYIKYDEDLAEYKPSRYFTGPRLLLRELISRQFKLQAVKVVTDFVTNKSMQSILILPGSPDLNYLLGTINSKLISWYFLHRSNIAQRDDFPKIVLKETRSLPIHLIDFSVYDDVQRHNQMVVLVERMLNLQQQLANSNTPTEKTFLQRQIDTTDHQIDALVYELYGLTDEEIRLVEGE